MIRHTGRRDQGFTIIEMLIATVVFSVILLVITAAILQFSRQYYRGVTASTTQGAARAIIDDVTRSIQFNAGGVQQLADANGYCVGSAKRYSYAQDGQVTSQSPDTAHHQYYHGLVSDTVPSCSSATASVPVKTINSLSGLNNARELLGEHMRVSKFDITGNNPYVITVRVVYGDRDLLCSPTVGDCNNPTSTAAVDNDKTDLQCKTEVGSQFCAVSELSTTVKKRVDL